MKKLLLTAGLALMVVAFMVVAGCTQSEPATVTPTATPKPTYDYTVPGYHTFNMTAVDGRTRRYTVYVPWSYDGVTPMPVVMSLHHANGIVESHLTEVTWYSKAEQEGFLVVYPNGSRINNDEPPSPLQFYQGQLPTEKIGPEDIDKWGNFQAWDDRWMGTATGDDVGFIDGLIDELAAKFAIDEKRVYVSGISAGGMMAWRLAEEIPHRLAAVAAVVAPHRMPDDVELKRAVPLISIIGAHDPIRIGSPEGGDMGIYGPKLLGLPTYMEPWQDQVDAWVEAIGASPEPEVIRDDERVTAVVYRGPGGIEAQFYTIHDMGHAWPGDMRPGSTGPKSDAVIGEDLIWDFFKRFSLGNP